ncbi:MAG: TetR/AcrR family transcriptional regulator [Candidatus Sumerlaeia bacterium]
MTTPETSAQNSYESILAAAEEVVRESGAVHLTLDAVAARAGVSKGGLLYHFRNKEALIRAMLTRMPMTVLDHAKDIVPTLPQGPGRDLRSAILATRDVLATGKMQGLSSSLLAAAYDPSLFAPIRDQRYEFIEKYSAQGLPKPFINAILLAIEGLWIMESLSIATDAREREEVIAQLVGMVEAEERRLTPTGGSGGQHE